MMKAMNEHRQDDELDDRTLLARLEAYAEAELGPDPAGMARIRASVLAEAARGARGGVRPVPVWARLFGRVGRSGAGGRGADGAVSGGAGARPVFVRRPGLALVAASLAVALLAGVASGGSAPGGPLYGARLWLETATLPADPAARTDAELARLEERIGEATTAAQSGNGAAVAAALEAYRATVDSTVVAADGDITRQQRLEIALEQHQVVLETLVTKLSGKGKDKGKASEAIQRALDKSAQTIERIMTETPRDKGGRHGSPGEPGAPGNDTGKPNGRSDHGRAPGGSPGPVGPSTAPRDGGPGMPTP